MNKNKPFHKFLIILFSFCLVCLSFMTFGGCRRANVRMIDNFSDEKPKGFVEFYLSDEFLKSPKCAEFKSKFVIDIYKYKDKGASRLYTEHLQNTLRIAEKPGKHTFFATVEGGIHSHKITVNVLDKKTTPVKIDILLGPSKSSTTINPYALGESFEYYEHTLQFYKMKATVYEPV